MHGKRCAECNCALAATSRGKAYSFDSLPQLLDAVGEMGKWSEEVKQKVVDRFAVCEIRDLAELRSAIRQKRLNPYMKAKGQKPFGRQSYKVLKSLALKMEFRFLGEYDIENKLCAVEGCERRACHRCLEAITGSWHDMPWLCGTCDSEKNKPFDQKRAERAEYYRIREEKEANENENKKEKEKEMECCRDVE